MLFFHFNCKSFASRSALARFLCFVKAFVSFLSQIVIFPRAKRRELGKIVNNIFLWFPGNAKMAKTWSGQKGTRTAKSQSEKTQTCWMEGELFGTCSTTKVCHDGKEIETIKYLGQYFICPRFLVANWSKIKRENTVEEPRKVFLFPVSRSDSRVFSRPNFHVTLLFVLCPPQQLSPRELG